MSRNGRSTPSGPTTGRALRVLKPSQDLRVRILAAAPVMDRKVTWSDRIWFSRAWRFAGAAATIAAIAASSWSSTDGHAVVVTPDAHASAHAVSDVSRALGIPEELSASFVTRTLANRTTLAGDARKRFSVDELETAGRR
ncbi:MAG TPA: hypothetical protein VFZ98_06600 [Vicinamibacterales bacterium]